MRLKDFPDYPYFKFEFENGFVPTNTALNILEYYGTPMKFEKN